MFSNVEQVIAQYELHYKLAKIVVFEPANTVIYCNSSVFGDDRAPVSEWVSDGNITDTGHDGKSGYMHIISGATWALRHCTTFYHGQTFNYVDQLSVWPGADPYKLDEALDTAYTLCVAAAA